MDGLDIWKAENFPHFDFEDEITFPIKQIKSFFWGFEKKFGEIGNEMKKYRFCFFAEISRNLILKKNIANFFLAGLNNECSLFETAVLCEHFLYF